MNEVGFDPEAQASLDKSGGVETPTLQGKLDVRPLRRIKRVGETEGPDTFQTGIDFLGEIHNVDLPDDEEYAAYQQEESRINGLLRNLKNITNEEAGKKLVAETKAAREKLAESVLKKKLKGIEGDGNRASEWRSMFFYDKIGLSSAIIAKSQFGSDFSEHL